MSRAHAVVASGGLLALLLLAPALAAPDAAVEVVVMAAELDDSAQPYIAEIEVTVTNRSEHTIRECDIALGYLDAAGKVLATRKHALGPLGLKPGAETLASFQDVDPPPAWARTVSVVAKCRS